MQYAKLIDLHRLSCFPVMAAGRSLWGTPAKNAQGGDFRARI
jgi:hypothetical protein